jgi:ferric iron reductase protein FhuF
VSGKLEFVEGTRAVEVVNDAIGRVRSAVSYLRAEVGDLVPYARPGSVPAEGEWIRCDELVRDSDWLGLVVRASGVALGTDDPVVAASLFVQNYSYRVLTFAIACLTTTGVVPDSADASMSITLAHGRPATVGYTKPLALVTTSAGVAISEVLQGPGTVAAAFDFIVAKGLDEHIAVLIDAVRAQIRVGARLLWGNVAASAAVAFRTMEGCLGPWVQPLGEQFFADGPVALQGLGSFLSLEYAGRRGWYWERTNCCLYDRLPGDVRCGDCSRTPAAQRRAAYLSSLQSP